MSIIHTLSNSSDNRVRILVDCWGRNFDYGNYLSYCQKAGVKTFDAIIYRLMCSVLDQEMHLMIGGDG